MDFPSVHTPRPTRGKVLVAMSGGVDSSVAAAMLVRDGWDVIGCFMRLGSPDESPSDGPPGGPTLRGGSSSLPVPSRSGTLPVPGGSELATTASQRQKEAKSHRQGCCSVGDAADARLVAAQLGIPLYICNFRKDFGRIIDYFVDEYANGRTPNPCVRCNDWLKFGKLHDYARQLGATHVASGHYARIVRDARGATARDDGENGVGGLRLMRGIDRAKDQSYVLFGMPRAQLAHTLFPIGDFADKAEVRAEAQRLGLPVFDKPDSYEICFVPDNDYARFVERQRPELSVEGRILNTAGSAIGRHGGQHRFTIGQRRGLGLGGSVMGGAGGGGGGGGGGRGAPAYVVARDPEANTVTLGQLADLMVTRCEAREANWLVDPARLTTWTPALAQYRAHGEAVPCRVRRSGGGGTAFEVAFASPQRAVAPGQAVVLYARDESVLGGGWIASVGRD